MGFLCLAFFHQFDPVGNFVWTVLFSVVLRSVSLHGIITCQASDFFEIFNFKTYINVVVVYCNRISKLRVLSFYKVKNNWNLKLDLIFYEKLTDPSISLDLRPTAGVYMLISSSSFFQTELVNQLLKYPHLKYLPLNYTPLK
jgi:hypothetical protein